MTQRPDPSARAAGDLPDEFGPYRVQRRLGRGGMGTVYVATDSRLNRQVALKVCHLADNPQALERFRREAQAAAALRHPNLCPIFDCDVHAGVPYFTMALIEGPTLDRWVQKRGGVTPREAALLARKLALALQYAHERGIVHRDLKPANVAMERAEPVILDFGLAKADSAGELKLTQQGALLGTPGYMAPEQVEGDPAAMGPRTDVYSLGVLFYELLTGEVPFDGPLAAVLYRILHATPAAPHERRPGVDPRLSAICLKALAKAPADRWESMAAFAAALTDWARATPATGTGPRLTAVRPPVAATLETHGGDSAARATAAPPPPAPPAVKPAAAVALAVGPPGRSRKSVAPEPGRGRRGWPVLLAAGVGVSAIVLVIAARAGLFGGGQVGGGPRPLAPAPSLPPVASAVPPPMLQIRPLERVRLTGGQSTSLALDIARYNCPGPVTFEVTTGLPPGVRVRADPIPDGGTSGRLEIVAGDTDALAFATTALVARAGTATAQTRLDIEVQNKPPPASTLRVTSAPTGVTVKPGEKVTVSVGVSRNSRRDPVTIRIDNLPPGVSAAPVTLAADSNRGQFELIATPEAGASGSAPTTAKVVATAGALRAEKEFRVTIERPRGTLILSAKGGPVSLKPGETKSVEVGVERVGYEGPVELRVRGQTTDVRFPTQIVVPAVAKTALLELSAAANAEDQEADIRVSGFLATGDPIRAETLVVKVAVKGVPPPPVQYLPAGQVRCVFREYDADKRTLSVVLASGALRPYQLAAQVEFVSPRGTPAAADEPKAIKRRGQRAAVRGTPKSAADEALTQQLSNLTPGSVLKLDLGKANDLPVHVLRIAVVR